jgi:dephospho-CoA kinase
MSNKQMLIIGVSGQTGAGKSTTADILSELGFGENYEIDKLGHEVLNEESIIKALVSSFGEDILDSEGLVDRRVLGQMAFSKPENILTLNAIMHPAMVALTKQHIKEAKEQGKKSIIINAALLFTMELDKLCNILIYVETDSDIRLNRLISNRGINKATAEKRLFSQDKMPLGRSNLLVIKNNGDELKLRKEAQQIASKLKEMAL